LIESLRKLNGQRVLLETTNGKKGGKVKSVSDTQIVLDKSFKIGDTVRRLPDEIVLIADLTAKAVMRHCPKLKPKTPDEFIAVAILAMACEDWEGMKTALAGAPGHLLHDRYKKKFDTLAPGQAEMTSHWSHHEKVTISGHTSALENHQVGLIVDYKAGMRANYADLLFTDQAKKPLSHWIETWSKVTAAVWVKVPSIPKTGTTITMHYGNPNAKPRSNGDATFIFFDDFSDGFNTAKWLRKRAGSLKSRGAFVRKGIMCIAAGVRSKKVAAWIMARRPLPSRLIIENRFRLDRTSDRVGGGIAILKAACKIDADGSPGRYALVNFHYNYQKSYTRTLTSAVWIYSGSGTSRSELRPYWSNEWFRQSHYYDGKRARDNVLYIRGKDGTLEQAIYSAPLARGNVRLHIWPVGFGNGPSHFFFLDWIAIRKYALPDVTVTIGGKVVGLRKGKPAQRRPEVVNASNFAGTWRVRYTNGSARTYQVGANDTVIFPAERRHGQLRRGKNVLLQFGDGRLERWRLVNGRLLVQHWNPASSYPARPPKVTGVGVRVR